MHMAVTDAANEELPRDAAPWALQGQPCPTCDLQYGLWSQAVFKEGCPGKTIPSNFATTTIMEPHSRGQQSREEKVEKMPLHTEDIRPEMKEDIHDPSYQDEEGPPPKLEYVWRNIFLMALLHLGALYGITLVPSSKVYTWLFGLLYNIVAALGITAGAHRLWSHRTYKARLPMRLFLIVANTMAFQNDVYEWARDHRVHHKFSETHADPHDSRRGFFFSHAQLLSHLMTETSSDKGSQAGEGFHNYHHTFPYDYSASEYRWHISFTTFFIDCMAALGLAYDRKRVSKAAVLAKIKRTGDGSHKSD
ncbi:acyl-CoA desaturase 1-like protein [Cricetulus griseus]|uniref:stearoyl-CoA 9-desaturase n=1 Tax=Cricetulus griseus TaxID=10029 RepID=A0A061IAN8_CRIGR|nr:acyl-CoA desaturase 1-like protein [Cricetulus griseus]